MNRLRFARFMVMLLPVEHLNFNISFIFCKVEQHPSYGRKQNKNRKNRTSGHSHWLWYKYTLEIWILSVYSGSNLCGGRWISVESDLHSRSFIIQSKCNPERLLLVHFTTVLFSSVGQLKASIWTIQIEIGSLLRTSNEELVRGKDEKWGGNSEKAKLNA